MIDPLHAPIENVIFDQDGTLVDSVEGVLFALNQAIDLEISGPLIPIHELRKRMGPPILQIIHELLPEISEEAALRIRQQFQKTYRKEGLKKSRLYDTVLDMLEGLKHKNVKIFVATNKPTAPTQEILEQTGITPYLTDSLSPDFDGTTSYSKSKLLSILLNKHELQAYNTCMVGDSIGDGEAARCCSLGFVLAAYGYGDAMDLKDIPVLYSLNQPVELLEYLNKRERP